MMPARTLAAMTVDLNFITVSFLCGLGGQTGGGLVEILGAPLVSP